MTQPPHSDGLPTGFGGVVRLFPLPNLVLFPHTVQALHIFEPRYRQMVEDALAGDQLIATARLLPGWEADYEGRPAIHAMTCVGKIFAHARLEDGRYNIMVRGLRRACVVREYPAGEFAFRLADVALVEDIYPVESAAMRSVLQRELLSMLERLTPRTPGMDELVKEMLGQNVSLGALTDVLGYVLPLDIDFKQALLAESNVDRRGSMLAGHLRDIVESNAGDGDFPPTFSEN